MMDWDKLRVFLAVAEAGSFTHAGDSLNLSQSAVSRQIGGLEESLTVPLFHRHARGLILTEQGELLFQTVKEIFAKLSVTEAMLNEARDRPKGPLRVTTTVSFGSMWLTPRIVEFLEAYPEIELTLLVGDSENLDLAMRQADVAIRLNPPRQAELIQRHLVTFRFHLYAAPGYLRRNGVPHSIDDLQNHRIVAYGEDTPPPFPDANWILHAGNNNGSARPAFKVNNFLGILRAVQTGAGIAALPDYMVRDEPNLTRILTDVEPPKVPAYFVYPEELRHSKRVAVLRDFLVRKVGEGDF